MPELYRYTSGRSKNHFPISFATTNVIFCWTLKEGRKSYANDSRLESIAPVLFIIWNIRIDQDDCEWDKVEQDWNFSLLLHSRGYIWVPRKIILSNQLEEGKIKSIEKCNKLWMK